MKKIITLTLLLVLLTSGILIQVLGQAAYDENFDLVENWSGGVAGSYTEKAYANGSDPQNDGFISDNAVRESTNSISGYAWRLKNEGSPFFIYECPQSLGSFSVFLAHWNLDVPMDISIEYSLDGGVSYTLIASINASWWTSLGLADKTYNQFLSGDLNISPEEGENICIRLTTNGGERLLIDDFQLIYNNGTAGVQDPLEFSATTASDSQIDLIFVPNDVDDDVVIVFDEDGSFGQPSGPPPVGGSLFAGGTLLYKGTVSPQVHSELLPEQMIFYKAWSFDGEFYSDGLMAQATTNGSMAIPNAWINEIHYDNDGGDVDEFVEIVIENAESYMLQNIELYLYNGSNGQVYATETADNFEAGITSDNFSFYTWYFPGIQNGAPEGIALAVNSELISGQLLSYEGVFIATEGPAANMTSIDIGVQEPTTNPIGYTLQLAGSGIMYEHFIWEDPAEGTPGSVNGQQQIGNFTYWTGTSDNNWDQEGNWSNGIPNSMSGACIPDINSSSSYFPEISNEAEVSTLVIEIGATLDITVNGALTVNGSFINSGTLTIHSDVSGSGSLIEPNGGMANVERFVTPDSWHYIAAPVSEIYSDIFDGWYLMNWDEAAESWNFIEDLGIPLNSEMQGYSIWTNAGSAVTFTGNLNTGPLSIELSNTPGTSNPENDPSGYNLVGNPYSSSLDWDVDDGAGWTRNNVAQSVYYWNGIQYASYVKGGPNPGPNGGSNIIPPHQGFFVRCTDALGGQLAVNNSARVHGNQPFYKQSNKINDFFRLKLKGSQFSDELLVQINDSSSNNFDPAFDAFKLYGSDEAPQIYTLGTDNAKLSINTFPYDQNSMVIPLGFRSAEDGMLDLALVEICGSDTLPLYLEDLYEQVVIDIKLSGSYSFFSGPGDFVDRFRLHFSDDEIQVHQLSALSETPVIFTKDQMIIIASFDNLIGRICISDLYGREVFSNVLPLSGEMEINMSGKRGFYIVRVVSDQGIFTQKVYIP